MKKELCIVHSWLGDKPCPECIKENLSMMAHPPAAYKGKPIPSRPWVASNQYGMHFILSADNEILWRADFVPYEMLKAMAEAANRTELQ